MSPSGNREWCSFRLFTKATCGIFLQSGIDRQLHDVARTVGLGRQFADQLARAPNLDPLAAGNAAKLLLEHLLKAFLADLEPRRDQRGFFSRSYSLALAAPT
jgi:hypothetical protein